MVGRSVSLEYEEERVRPTISEVKKLISNNRKAKDLMGWQPKVTIDEGLERTLHWFRENLKEYKSDLYTI